MRYHITSKGRVQGVNYRFFVKRTAERLGIRGWVRNLSNGDVEAVLEGEKENLDEMVKEARQGPVLARVDDLDIKEEKEEGLSSFVIK